MSIIGTTLRPVIIVSEDEWLVRMFAADFLDEAGFDVLEAANADEALMLLRTRPDVQAIVTDVEMPNGSINGFELARRARERLPGLAILIVSGRAVPEPDDLPDDARFLAKPYHPMAVLASLNEMIAAHDASRRHK